jgi:hypothetical protein
MIIGIWWQHEYSSTTAGYIHNIEKFMWKDSSDWREMDLTEFFDGLLWDGEKQAADKRKEIAYLERPIYTNEVRLMGLSKYAISFLLSAACFSPSQRRPSKNSVKSISLQSLESFHINFSML